MDRYLHKGLILWLSFPLAALVIIVSITGLTTPGFYAAETANWQAQSMGQDMADLFLVAPALIVTALLAHRKKKGAVVVWGGVVVYLFYTFLIYCVGVHFNQLFLIYCLALGISFYCILLFFYCRLYGQVSAENFKDVPATLVGFYFILLSVLFYFLWLSEIVPATINKEIPRSVKDTGLPVNIVHVLDLAILLPGIFITGILLIKKKLAGYVMAPLLLSFFILMDITIGGLVVLMKYRGLDGDYSLTYIMTALTLFSTFVLIWYIRKMNVNPTQNQVLPE